ncbi:MAG: DUF4956 domain-containing protein [Prevotella sp.]|nr:DUF4956 domain-containing protein [Prevotella sp.]MBR6087356.1 DUF4956 domain-containing protein [Prevotella sp.]
MVLFSTGFADTMLRFVVCSIVNLILVYGLYYRKSGRRDFSFTFTLISVAIYFLVYLMMGMERGKATMGVGLGLFGIFSIMRYRTDSMPVREMTYLFIVVCLSVVHAMSSSMDSNDYGIELGTPLTELIAIDLITIAAVTVCELTMSSKPTKLIQYDRIELVKTERRQELIDDLQQRLGITITDVKVGAVDFLHDMAMLRITYTEEGNNGKKDVDNMLKLKKSQYAEV